VLRRRAADLESEGYNAQYVGVLLRAADELEVRTGCATREEDIAVEVEADNRYLRRMLDELYGQIRSQHRGWRDEVLAKIARTLKVVRSYGKPRRLLATTVGDGATREELLAAFNEQLDRLFPTPAAEAAPHGVDGDSRPGHITDGEKTEGEETAAHDVEAAQPEGAGRDADQRERAEA
jgi:hypothetical protein